VPAAECFLREARRGYGVSGLIANSVVSDAVAIAALYADVPTVSLIHEFSEYTTGIFADVSACADRIILPAPLLAQSAAIELTSLYGAVPNNVLVRHQGYIEQQIDEDGDDIPAADILRIIRPGKPRPRIILGAGFIHPRKGVDLFLQTAAALKAKTEQDFCFIWVGAGGDLSDLRRDIQYGVWLLATRSRMGLDEIVYFLPHQSNLATLFGLADVFFLSSRMDPYPNVLVDALRCGKPVVCFAGSTGAEELFDQKKAFGRAVPFADVHAAADVILELFDPLAAEVGRNRHLVETEFNFDDYADFVAAALEEAKRSREELIGIRNSILDAGQLDAVFYTGDSNGYLYKSRSATHFAALTTKGLAKFNPRPGLSACFKARADLESPLPVLSALVDGRLSHETDVLRGHIAYRPPKKFAAVHLHLHYPNVEDEFVSRLNSLGLPLDVFVTTTSEKNRIRIEAAFLNYRFGRTKVLRVENIGRDIGPLLCQLDPAIREGGYAVVGHFHGKKTKDIVEQDGKRWLDLLLGTLLGESRDVSEILAGFAYDDSLGLVFAESRIVWGWTQNRAQAAALASRLNPRPEVPDFPLFPIGNMFWVRTKVLEPLWNARFSREDFPPEPVPHDGTVLHAIERMMPAICESVGLRWKTVLKEGVSR
jgi:glycosyltransferase involved in cell wall biosynthesis